MISMARFLNILIVIPIVVLGFMTVYQATSTMVFAASPSKSPKQIACEGSGGKWEGNTCKSQDSNGPAITTTIKNIINTLLFITGVAAVIVIVISGFRFVTSNGDAGAVSKAKNSIIYAVVGIVVAVSAYAIVNFILEQL